VLFVRKTRASMSTTVLQTWEDEVLVGRASVVKAGAGRDQRRTYTFPNGSTVDVAGLDKPERLMSSQYDFIFCFESTELTLNDYEMLTTRLTGQATPYQQIVLDCNPASDKHWLMQLVRAGKMHRFPSRLEDNPRWHDGENWTPRGLDLIERLGNLSGVRRARLFEGKWVAAEGQIYGLWSELVHVIDYRELPREWRRIRVIDFGYTNSFVCMWMALSPDDEVYVYREIGGPKRTVAEWHPLIEALSAGETYEATVADHDAEDRATLERLGIITIAADKAVMPGIQGVQERLKVRGNLRPRLFVMRDSIKTDQPYLDQEVRAAGLAASFREEVDGYVWAKTPDGKPSKEEPLKVNDHYCDALRYGCRYFDNMNYAGEHDATVAPGVNATDGDYWVPLDRYGGWG
jgi:phage terminase large subunit